MTFLCIDLDWLIVAGIIVAILASGNVTAMLRTLGR
jgi:hypothetical protein